jgi:hypothetical protein
MSKERPILFSGPMVRALLDGSKTQTRRPVKGFALELLKPDNFTHEYVALPENGNSPYGYVGDRLWVRETLAPTRDNNGIIVDWHYAADGAKRMPGLNPDFNDAMAFAHLARPSAVPSIHMPRWASRITLEVTGVRVERLHDISETDAQAEGIPIDNGVGTQFCRADNRQGFRQLWESINGAESWTANPWVWVVEFKRI